MIALESGTQALNHLIFPTLLWGREALLSLFGKHIDKRVELCFQPKLGKLVPVISGVLINWSTHDTHLIQRQFKTVSGPWQSKNQHLWKNCGHPTSESPFRKTAVSNPSPTAPWETGLAQKYTSQRANIHRRMNPAPRGLLSARSSNKRWVFLEAWNNISQIKASPSKPGVHLLGKTSGDIQSVPHTLQALTLGLFLGNDRGLESWAVEGITDVLRYVLIRIPAQFSSVNYSLIWLLNSSGFHNV